MADLQQIGQMLGGFGAGIQGQLPSFIANQQNQQRLNLAERQMTAEEQRLQEERKARMQQERQKAYFQDIDAVSRLIDAGEVEAAFNLLGDRAVYLSQMGSDDPSDTATMLQLAATARNGDPRALDLLKKELSAQRTIGQAYGLIETPEEAEYTLSPGQVRMRGTQEIGRGAAIPEKREVVQIFKPDGSAVSAMTDGAGNFYDTQGKPIQLSAQDRIIEGSTLSGGTAEMGLSKTEQADLRTAQIATENFIGTVNDALARIAQFPDVNTMVAKAAGIANNLKQEVKAIGRQFDINFDESMLEPEKHAATFKELGLQEARMQSLITSLAYSQALANNPDGRVSNADLNRAIREVGASASDPETLRQVLTDVADRTVRNFKTNYQVRMGRPFEGSLSEIGKPSQAPGAVPTVTTQAEFDALPSGAVFIEDGVRYRKP